MNKPYTFVFFGIVGSGKGTQVELLQKYLKDKNLVSDIVFVSTGVEFRRIITSDNYTGRLIKETNDRGNLQPDFFTISIFINTLMNGMTETSSLIADAYPRTIPQSIALEDAMKYYKRDDIKVIYIEVGKEEAVKRMKLRARADDSDEGITRRFDEYVRIHFV